MLFVVNGALSAQGLFPRLGEQRVGTSAMTFLKIDLGARAAGMAGAFVPLANDATAMFWNPAGLVQIGANQGIVSHIQWPVDIQYEYAGYVQQISPIFAFGVNVGFLYTEDMEVTDEYHPNGTGEYFGYNDLFTAVSFSFRMTDRFSFGASVKYVQENLADLRMNAVMLDFGTYYWTGFKSLRFAASLRNFGPNIRPGGTYLKRSSGGTVLETNYADFSPPTNFALGAAMEMYESEKHKMTLSLQMNHPMDNAETAVLGSEYTFHHNFTLRSGYRFGFDESHWTFGAGAVLPIAGVNMKIDYAYADLGSLNMTQQFTIYFCF